MPLSENIEIFTAQITQIVGPKSERLGSTLAGLENAVTQWELTNEQISVALQVIINGLENNTIVPPLTQEQYRLYKTALNGINYHRVNRGTRLGDYKYIWERLLVPYRYMSHMLEIYQVSENTQAIITSSTGNDREKKPEQSIVT